MVYLFNVVHHVNILVWLQYAFVFHISNLYFCSEVFLNVLFYPRKLLKQSEAVFKKKGLMEWLSYGDQNPSDFFLLN